MARLIEKTMTMDASTENAFRHASAVPAGFADQVKVSLEVHDLIIHELHKINRQFLERSAEDAGASRVEHAGMFIHSRCEVPQTASGTRTQRAGDESIECRNGDGGLVNDNFKVADAMTTLVRVGELQRHGMTVASPHGNGVTRSRVMRLEVGSTWNLGRAVSVSKGLVGFASVEPSADIVRVNTGASVTATANTLKRPGAVEESRDELIHKTYKDWCLSCVAGRRFSSPTERLTVQSCNRGRYEQCRRSGRMWRFHKCSSWTRLSRCQLWCNARCPWFRRYGEPWKFRRTNDWHRESDSYSRSFMMEYDRGMMSSRVAVASLGWTTVSMREVESRPTMAKAAAKVVSDILASLSLEVLYVRGCLDAKSLLHPDQEVGLSLNLMKRSPESNATIGIM